MSEKVVQTDTRESETKARVAELKYALYLSRQNPLVLGGLILVVIFLVLAVSATVIVSPDEAFKLEFAQSYCWSSSLFSWTQLEASCPVGTNFVL